MINREAPSVSSPSFLLPATSLPEFTVPRLAAPQEVWRNPEISADLDLSAYAYCAPHLDDDSAAFLPQTKTFQAERYGGIGVASNGGGVRCGLEGAIQVKGTGRNGLLGKRTDFNHSNGGASLEEGIREAIWGEVAAFALPYGAARVHGIIATGTRTYFQGPGVDDGMIPRVLILRQAMLRPAHYMRAIDCDLADPTIELSCSDAARTRAAVAEIDLGLSTLLSRQPQNRHDPDFINEGLMEMARRFACQLATSNVKRIPHGALNCSNIALDGRFLDFGTMTAISDYGRVIVIKGQPDIWRSHTYFKSTFYNLTFYLRHYLPGAGGSSVIGGARLNAHFLAHYHARVTMEFLKLTGIPEASLLHNGSAKLTDLWLSIQRIIARKNREPFQMPQMPETMGAFNLNAIFRAACLCSDAAQMERELQPLLGDSALRRQFIDAYFVTREHYLNSLPADARAHGSFMMTIEAMRRNTPLMALCRNQLEPAILALLRQPDSISAVPGFIDNLLCQARTLLAETGTAGVDLSWYVGKPLHATAAGLTGQGGSPVTIDTAIAMLDPRHFSDQQKQMISTLCH